MITLIIAVSVCTCGKGISSAGQIFIQQIQQPCALQLESLGAEIK